MAVVAVVLILTLAAAVFVTGSLYRNAHQLTLHTYQVRERPPATVSIGVSTYPEHGGTPEALLRMADQALYRAKQLGRNKIASANDLVQPSHARPATPA